jgi:hypothetical protein
MKKQKPTEAAPLLDLVAKQPADPEPTPNSRNGYLFLNCPGCGNVLTGGFYQISEAAPLAESHGPFGDSSTLDLSCPCGVRFHGYARIEKRQI